MDVLEFNRRFMQIEEEIGLFPDTRVADPGWWDVVRHDVMKHVYHLLADDSSETPTPPKFTTRLRHLVSRIKLRIDLEIRMLMRRHDVLIYRAPRLMSDGYRIDTGLDQVIAACPGRKLVINTFPHRYDQSFARVGRLAPRPVQLDELEHRLFSEFGCVVELDKFVRQRLADFEICRRHYAKVLARVRPRLVLINQNGIEKALFWATREAGIPALEVQHGLINAAHPNYAYPSSVHGEGLAMFPDVIFMFSQFWIDGCHHPARHRIVVGNDFFYPGQIPLPKSCSAILVISANKYHEALVRYLRATAPKVSERHFFYKLHPAQDVSLISIQQELADLTNVTVHGSEVTVQEMLAKVSDVVLVQSTVAYEAVQAGRRLLIIPEMDYATHTDLMSLEGVKLVKDANALVEALIHDWPKPEKHVFFEPFDSTRATRILELLLTNNAPFAPEGSNASSPRTATLALDRELHP